MRRQAWFIDDVMDPAMIRIRKTGELRQTAPAKKASRASVAFQPDASSQKPAVAGASETAPSPVLGALIALQSDAGGNAKTFAAAQRTLDLLDQLQIRMLETGATTSDLEALSSAATVRAHAGADPKLQQIYDEIALRARVELAKFGR